MSTGMPPVADRETWQRARDELLLREKAHTREGDAIAAARRRLPMVEIDGSVEVAGADGPVPFLSLFEDREELIVYTVPDGWPAGREACWYWRTDDAGAGGGTPTSRPAPRGTRPGADPVTTLGRHAHHH